jgi:ABC-type microcin C transport system duplicated ATPase subunit YejF
MLLDVADLRTHFLTPAGAVPAVAGVLFSVAKGRTLALVGEIGLRQDGYRALAAASAAVSNASKSAAGPCLPRGICSS